MPLRRLDLPEPARMRGRWAALAAVLAARGWGRHCCATGPVWHYDDGGGNWVQLHHVDRDRAVLVGHDHEYSETYFGTAADYFDEPQTDLLAGAPPWWGQPAGTAMAAGLWVGFVYGFADGGWQRADYDVEDGFAAVALPALDDESSRDHIITTAADSPGLTGKPDRAAVDALLAADAHITHAHLAAVIGSAGWSVPAGVAAGHEFLATP